MVIEDPCGELRQYVGDPTFLPLPPQVGLPSHPIGHLSFQADQAGNLDIKLVVCLVLGQ